MFKQKIILCLTTLSALTLQAGDAQREMARALAQSAQAEMDSNKTRTEEARAAYAKAQAEILDATVRREELAAAERITLYHDTLALLLGEHRNDETAESNIQPNKHVGGNMPATGKSGSSQIEVNLSNETFKSLKSTLKDVVRKHAAKQKSLLRKKAKYDQEQAGLEHSHTMEKLTLVGQGFSSLLADKERLINTGLAIGGTALAVYLAKRSTSLLFSQAGAYLNKPALIDETSRLTLSTAFNRTYWTQRITGDNCLDEVVVSPAQKARLARLTFQMQNIKKHDGNMQNLLLYGAPGTGKTLFIKQLARASGMHYAFLSGSNFSRFAEKERLEELRKLFAWAATDNTILFFDECEIFAKKRGGDMSETHGKTLSSWLALTGTESKNVMVAGATNRPADLDAAALSRFPVKIEFSLPREAERMQLLYTYYRKHVKQGPFAHATDFTEEEIDTLVARTEGFSGRDISSMMNRVYTIGLAKDVPSIEFADCLLALDEINEEHYNLANFSN